ncbi:MAG: FAD-dependent oxidoreductase [Blastocatellia bacterium]
MNTINTIKKQVVVVGAGAAGITAAIAAARNGAEVLLVEYHGFVGGISATLAWLGFHDSVYRQVVKGLPMEFVTRLQQAGAASRFVLDPKCSSAVGIDIHYWKIIALQMLEEAGVELMLHTQVVDTLRAGDRITGIVVQNKSGCQHIHADIVIDCSGDGDVAARGGVAWEKGRTADGLVQAPTLVFRIGGIDRAGFIAGCKNPAIGYREWLLPYPDLWAKMMQRIDDEPLFITGGFAGLIEQARRNGDFDVPQSRIVGIKSHVPDEFIVVTTRVLGLDPTDVRSLTDAYTKLYQQIPLIVNFFRRYMPGCAAAHLREIAPMMGIRESRRIMGDYVLTKEDVVEGRRFDDAVSMGGYHVDIHNPSGTWVHSSDVEAYTIPFRSLVARDVEGLLMAGKCLSATHEAVASTRVIPICMGQGQAVGTAAALAVRAGKSVRDVRIGALQDTLISQGAELGQSLGEPDDATIERIGVMPKSNHVVLPEQDQVSGLETAWVK